MSLPTIYGAEHLLFITDPSVDHKLANLILLHLRRWDVEVLDFLRLVTTKDPSEIEPSLNEDPKILEATVPPLTQLDNAWAGATRRQVEKYFMRLYQEGTRPCVTCRRIFIMVDQEGVRTQTCVWHEQIEDSRFHKIRIPWADLAPMFDMRDAGIRDWYDFVNECCDLEYDSDNQNADGCWCQCGADSKGFFTYNGHAADEESTWRRRGTQFEKDEFARLRREGLVPEE